MKFLKYVKAGLSESTGDFQDEFVQKLQSAVRNVKASREMDERYMLLEEMLKDEREAGRAVGRAEGKAEGKAESILRRWKGRASGCLLFSHQEASYPGENIKNIKIIGSFP